MINPIVLEGFEKLSDSTEQQKKLKLTNIKINPEIRLIFRIKASLQDKFLRKTV